MESTKQVYINKQKYAPQFLDTVYIILYTPSNKIFWKRKLKVFEEFWNLEKNDENLKIFLFEGSGKFLMPVFDQNVKDKDLIRYKIPVTPFLDLHQDYFET